MSRRTIVYDIETRPAPEMGPWTDESFPPPPYHRVTTLAWCEIDGPRVRFDSVQGDERAILLAFRGLLSDRPRIVSWNGRGFDLPVIIARSIRHQIHQATLMEDSRTFSYTSRFKDDHVDLMDKLSLHGGARRAAQDVYARVVGGPGKHVGNGADVEAMTVEQERAYCLDDVAQLALIFCEWRRLHGAEVEPIRDAILAAIEATPDLEPLHVALGGAPRQAGLFGGDHAA